MSKEPIKLTLNKAQIKFPNITSDGFRASAIHMDFVKDLLLEFPPFEGLSGIDFEVSDFRSAKIDHYERLELTSGVVFELTHRIKENAKLRKLVKKYVDIMKLDSLVYVNFSNEFELVELNEEEEAKDVKLTNKK